MPKAVLILIGAEFMVQLIHTGFFLIMNIYLAKEGYQDEEIASFVSLRYLAVWVLALPVGFLIRGIRLKPLFLASTLLVPVSAVAVLQGVSLEWAWLVHLGFFMFGVGLMLMQVCVFPFVMRTCKAGQETEAISLSYSTFSIAMVLAGALIAGLSWFGAFSLGSLNWQWDEAAILYLLAGISVLGSVLVLRVQEPDPNAGRDKLPFKLKGLCTEYDWKLILEAVFPTTIIAIGAGLTIPFTNLFFYQVFGLDSDGYGVMGMLTAVLIAAGALLVPAVRRRFGYKVAITLTQIVAVMLLTMLAFTELMAGPAWVFWLAVFCFMLRQPLMNMAGPMTSELVLNYVGKRNQELVSAIISAIWSGSWFASAKFFQWFRAAEIPYYQIFLITSATYVVGVALYYRLILVYRSRSGSSGREN